MIQKLKERIQQLEMQNEKLQKQKPAESEEYLQLEKMYNEAKLTATLAKKNGKFEIDFGL